MTLSVLSGACFRVRCWSCFFRGKAVRARLGMKAIPVLSAVSWHMRSKFSSSMVGEIFRPISDSQSSIMCLDGE